jgi:hypothetical protein
MYPSSDRLVASIQGPTTRSPRELSGSVLRARADSVDPRDHDVPGRGSCPSAAKGQEEDAVMPRRSELYPDSRVLERLAASDAPIMSSVLSSTVTRQVFPQAGQ